jgi:hypothetical protein
MSLWSRSNSLPFPYSFSSLHIASGSGFFKFPGPPSWLPSRCAVVLHHWQMAVSKLARGLNTCSDGDHANEICNVKHFEQALSGSLAT